MNYLTMFIYISAGCLIDWAMSQIISWIWLSRIKHTYILDDPFEDPAQLAELIPDGSPELRPPAEVKTPSSLWMIVEYMLMLTFSRVLLMASSISSCNSVWVSWSAHSSSVSFCISVSSFLIWPFSNCLWGNYCLVSDNNTKAWLLFLI